MAPNRSFPNTFPKSDSAHKNTSTFSELREKGVENLKDQECLYFPKNSKGSEISKAPKSSTVTVCKSFIPPSTSDEKDGGNKGIQGCSGNQESGHGNQGSSSGSAGREDKRNKPPDISKVHTTYSEEDMKQESKRIKTFSKSWPHAFLSPKSLAEAGFYFVKDDVVRCAFCKIEVGLWEEGDIPRKEHKRWSGNCPFIRGTPCGNIPITSGGASSSSSDTEPFSDNNCALSYDVCGIHEEMRPFSFCDDETTGASTSNSNITCLKSVLGSDIGGAAEGMPKQSLEKLGVRDIRAPVHPEYCTEAARLATYSQWPLAIKQRPKDLSEAGFYYTGNGDQTLCFHCGGGLKDWEEGDDPWVEHAKWFSRCHFLNLVKGSDFISQITETMPALITAEEVRGLGNPCLPGAGPDTASSSSLAQQECENIVKSSSSSTKTKAVEATENKAEETKEIKDDGRLCKICYSAELGVVFLPCGHMVACVRCAPSLFVCPVCRQPFSHTVRAFLS